LAVEFGPVASSLMVEGGFVGVGNVVRPYLAELALHVRIVGAVKDGARAGDCLW